MSLRAVRPTDRYETSEDVAQLGQRMRSEMLAWAGRRFPAPWDHEEVLQKTLAVIAFDPGARGDEDHVRGCLYGTFAACLKNRFRDERLQVVADAPLHADAVERLADADPSIDPPTRAIEAWHRAVVEDLLAGYSETERWVIRLRYRGGERARKMDGVVSRKQCAKMLGIDLAQVRSIEDRVVGRLDAQIAAYDRTCQRREKEIELAARHAAGQDLSALVQLARDLLTGTPISNYVNDVFWLLWWTLGEATLRFPYSYDGGRAKFELDFCVIEWHARGGKREARKGSRA